MKTLHSSAVLVLAITLAGCTTSSKVQEMIDASHRDYTNRSDAHEASIIVLKRSAMTGLEKSKENAVLLVELQAVVTDVDGQIRAIKGYAEASNVLSAANTVKVFDLENAMNMNKELFDAAAQKLEEIDKLYEKVMTAHYQKVLDSATEAIELLKTEGWGGNTIAPVKIDEPIEIIAPNTSVDVTAANAVPVE